MKKTLATSKATPRHDEELTEEFNVQTCDQRLEGRNYTASI
jgi:hypothetical protein